MSRRALIAWLILASGAMAPSANACSCLMLTGTPDELVRQALDDADVVFVARLLRSALKPDRQDRRLVVEDAQFKILEVFKGELREGQLIRVRQILSAGTCGQSSTNDPPWMYSQERAGGVPEPVKVSKEWLIYAHGGEPFELSRCTRTTPMNADPGKDDVKSLRKIVKKASRKH
jgi:hypothetical protein